MYFSLLLVLFCEDPFLNRKSIEIVYISIYFFIVLFSLLLFLSSFFLLNCNKYFSVRTTSHAPPVKIKVCHVIKEAICFVVDLESGPTSEQGAFAIHVLKQL